MFDFYNDLLAFGGMRADGDGYIKTGENLQVMVKGKALVMPTREHLATITEKNEEGKIIPVKVVFHPLKESAIKSEGPVLNKLRTAIASRLNYSMLIVMEHMLNLALNNQASSKLKGTPLRFLASLSTVTNDPKTTAVDDKTLKIFTKLFEAGANNNFYKNLVGVYVKKGGLIDSDRFKRITVISFPLYEEICNSKNRTVRGIKLRVKDIALFKALYLFMFPNINDQSSLQFGSNDGVSPGVVSLLNGTGAVAETINSLANVFKINSKEHPEVRFDTKFINDLESLDDFIGEINAIPIEETGRTINPVDVAEVEGGDLDRISDTSTKVTKTSKGIDPRSIISANPPPFNQMSPPIGTVGYQQPVYNTNQQPMNNNYPQHLNNTSQHLMYNNYHQHLNNANQHPVYNTNQHPVYNNYPQPVNTLPPWDTSPQSPVYVNPYKQTINKGVNINAIKKI